MRALCENFAALYGYACPSTHNVYTAHDGQFFVTIRFMDHVSFPKNFLWGAATSAHQVEGGNRNDWEKFLPAGAACDHYNRYEEDFDIAKQLGHNTHRFSLEWSRMEPEEGVFDEHEIEHYRKVIQAVRARGMEPFVTIWHWTLPLWVRDQGGWENKKTIDDFSRFCDIISRLLKDVAFWITINEPMIYAMNGYMRGKWPPRKKSFFAFLRVLRHVLSAHKKAYEIIKQAAPRAQIGIAKNNVYFDGGFLQYPARWWWNHWFLQKIKNHQDFIGLNYYFHNHIRGFRFNQNENKIISDMGWEIYPEGIYHALRELKKYNKPIYITENGIADAADAKRGKFIRDHLAQVHRSIQEGADVRGYFYWSLLDNFEWDSGYAARFGLVEVDYKTQVRKIRQSAWEYKKIIQSAKFKVQN